MSARGSVQVGCDYATALNIEVDPQRRCFDRRESDFALQRLVACALLKLKSDWFAMAFLGCVAMAFQRQ